SMHQRDLRSMPPQIKRSDSRRILSADHHHIQPKEGMRLMIVVLYLAKIFARNSKIIRQIVISRSDHKLARTMLQHAPKAIHSMNGEAPTAPSHALDLLIL